MKARVAALPTRALIAIALGAVLLYIGRVWFLLVAAEAVRGGDALRGRHRGRAPARRCTAPAETAACDGGPRVSDVLRLAKAMPSSADQAGLVLELDRLARASGVTLGSITPSEAVVGAGGRDDDPGRRHHRRARTGRSLAFSSEPAASSGCGEARSGRPADSSPCRPSSSPSRTGRASRSSTPPSPSSAYVYDGPIVPETPPPGAQDTEEHLDRRDRCPEHAMTPRRARSTRAEAEDLRRRRAGSSSSRCSRSSCRSSSAARRPPRPLRRRTRRRPSRRRRLRPARRRPSPSCGRGSDVGGDHREAHVVHRLRSEGSVRAAGRHAERRSREPRRRGSDDREGRRREDPDAVGDVHDRSSRPRPRSRSSPSTARVRSSSRA